jgi:transposase InsO family protein
LVAASEKVPHVRRFWTDNGDEFMKDFTAVLKEREIRQRHTPPRNPEPNGKIELWWQSPKRVSDEEDVAPPVGPLRAMPPFIAVCQGAKAPKRKGHGVYHTEHRTQCASQMIPTPTGELDCGQRSRGLTVID